jgi:hypothetical protein
MRSFIAALRTLVLPFGATSGRRIVLDGTLGTITIYDTGGNKLLTLDGTNGIAVYDTAGNIRTQLALPGGQYSFIELATAQSSEIDQGFILNQGIGSAPNQKSTLSIGPSDLGQNSIRWKLISNQNAATEPLIVLDTSQLPVGVTGRPILNLVGTDFGGAPLQPRVVADDYWIGSDAGATTAPTMLQSLGRGAPVVGRYISAASDVARAAGVNTNAFVTFDAKSTRVYAVTVKSQITVGTAAVLYAAELVDGGVVGTASGTVVERVGRWQPADVPAASLSPFMSARVLYLPAASGSKTLRIGNAVGSGGTLQLIGGAGNPTTMLVEDVGART